LSIVEGAALPRIGRESLSDDWICSFAQKLNFALRCLHDHAHSLSGAGEFTDVKKFVDNFFSSISDMIVFDHDIVVSLSSQEFEPELLCSIDERKLIRRRSTIIVFPCIDHHCMAKSHKREDFNQIVVLLVDWTNIRFAESYSGSLSVLTGVGCKDSVNIGVIEGNVFLLCPFRSIIGSVRMLSNRKLLKKHDILGESSCLVTEDLLDLPKLLVKVVWIVAHLGDNPILFVEHLLFVFHEECLPEVDQLHGNHKGNWHEVGEDQNPSSEQLDKASDQGWVDALLFLVIYWIQRVVPNQANGGG